MDKLDVILPMSVNPVWRSVFHSLETLDKLREVRRRIDRVWL
ncbi:hypothetical protein ACNKHT_22005 [Shigella flexneri]